MPRVIHFEIAAQDPDRACDFYQKVFGWKIEKWNGPVDYWMVTTGEKSTDGINGALMRIENNITGTINTIDVPDINAFIDKVKAARGEVVMPVQTIPGVGLFTYCKDTEGNMFGIMQSVPEANKPE